MRSFFLVSLIFAGVTCGVSGASAVRPLVLQEIPLPEDAVPPPDSSDILSHVRLTGTILASDVSTHTLVLQVIDPYEHNRLIPVRATYDDTTLFTSGLSSADDIQVGTRIVASLLRHEGPLTVTRIGSPILFP